MHNGSYSVVLAGNPNVGKSTLFNTLTGMHQHTGNWPGKTVENARGLFRFEGETYVATDVPGSYSLITRSREEEEAIHRICAEEADVIVVVCDACSLVRSLNLALQIAELTPRILICVNLLDEADKRGVHIDLPLLESRLGVPVVGTSARSGLGLKALKSRIAEVAHGKATNPTLAQYPQPIEAAISRLCKDDGLRFTRRAALSLLESDHDAPDAASNEALHEARLMLEEANLIGESLRDAVVSSLYRAAECALEGVVTFAASRADKRQAALDRLLTNSVAGAACMIALLFVVFSVTIYGANILSDLLSPILRVPGQWLGALLVRMDTPKMLAGTLIDGAYKTLSWVISVMLPPMAIFFPLFTLLEELGYLPRVAFNLDRPLRCCGGCGRQALSMCMGFGCNAVGVTGCRIIESPRERLIAQLTNALVPCNGRFPTLIALITIFFTQNSGRFGAPLAAAYLTLIVLAGVGLTFVVSKLLSVTVLRGYSSIFTLELPPYRMPQVRKIIVRSLFDRVLFVLGRAAIVAAPAGAIIYLLANVCWNGTTPLAVLVRILEPAGRALGFDGTLLTAFLFGLPANEIVLPLAAMMYSGASTLVETGSAVTLGALLTQNGWTIKTALCAAIFTLAHWPCATTILTLRKETGSAWWTLVGTLLPTLVGVILCLIVNAAATLFFGG